MTRFGAVADVAAVVAATSKRNEKRAAIAELLAGLEPDEVVTVVGVLVGDLRQGRIGVGWASVRDLDVVPATEPTIEVLEVDAAVDALAAATGPGSQARRHDLLSALFSRATAAEADLLGRLFVGEIRTGALAGVVTDAVAVAAGIAAPVVRRAVMLAGDLREVARIALVQGEDAVASVGLEPLRPVQPMLASTAASVTEAVAEIGECSVEWKLDGARIQVHRAGDEVAIYTRNLNDVTSRLPEVVDLVLGFASSSFVLDGEVLGYGGDPATEAASDDPGDPDRPGELDGPGDPQAFQDTMSRFGRDDPGTDGSRLVPSFFDLLHLNGVDRIDDPLVTRRGLLADLVGAHLVPGVVTADADEAEAVLVEAIDRGHEGVMVKGASSTYEAGRRGKSWRKVKPVHTLDLVVLAVEWGHGRRKGWLSNLHLGALDPDSGEAVMVGKTFKGLTDELLEWQTARFRDLAVRETDWTVWVDPVQVVEIAVDGAQVSTRYPGGVALRFARVKRYRDDKGPEEADTLDAVRALLPRGRSAPPGSDPGEDDAADDAGRGEAGRKER